MKNKCRIAAYGLIQPTSGLRWLVSKLQAQFPPGTPERKDLDAALQIMLPPGAAGIK